MIRKNLSATLLAAALASTAQAEQSTNPTATGIVTDPNSCMACHQGGLSLARYPAEELAQRITTLRSNPVSHPPLQLEQASEADIRKLASALSPVQSEQ